MTEPKTTLSASRIKTLQSCSWLYWCKYKLNLPDKGNDGSSRGTVCHFIFELLGKPRREKIHQYIIDNNDPFSHGAIKRLVLKHALKLQVADEENLESIRIMILNGLKYDFYGRANGLISESFSEKDFEIVRQDEKAGISYKIKGFIDKLFLYKNENLAIIRDFKSSKEKFKGKEISDNLQDYMYNLAVRHMFPEFKKRVSEFLFLKFELDQKLLQKSDGAVVMERINEDDLDGFEHQLTSIQKYIDELSEIDAKSNFAKNAQFPTDKSFSGPLQCGFAKYKGELKKDGKPKWACAMKFDFHYYVILKDGKVTKSFFEQDFDESLVESGHSFEKRYYAGCPAHLKRS